MFRFCVSNFRTVVSITASIFLSDPVKCNVLTTTWWRKLKASDLIGATNIRAVPIFLYTVSPDSFFKSRAHETSFDQTTISQGKNQILFYKKQIINESTIGWFLDLLGLSYYSTVGSMGTSYAILYINCIITTIS